MEDWEIKENERRTLSAKRLKEERKKAQLTQEQFCSYLHYSSAKSISFLENGKTGLSRPDAVTAAAALGVRVEYLLGHDNYRTFDEMKKVDESANIAALEYFKSIGFSFWPCYVWRASVYAALCGYQLFKPFIAQNLQLTLIHNGCQMTHKADVANEFFEKILENSLDLSQPPASPTALEHAVSALLSDICLPIKIKTSTDIKSGYCFAIPTAIDTELCLFELRENPFSNSEFTNRYLELVELLAPGRYMRLLDKTDQYINSLSKARLFAELETSRPLANIDAPIKSANKQPIRDTMFLQGFLAGSSVELLYGLSKDGVFQGFSTIENMRRIFAIVDGSSKNAIDSLFN